MRGVRRLGPPEKSQMTIGFLRNTGTDLGDIHGVSRVLCSLNTFAAKRDCSRINRSLTNVTIVEI